jgi:hypothetical protein
MFETNGIEKIILGVSYVPHHTKWPKFPIIENHVPKNKFEFNDTLW